MKNTITKAIIISTYNWPEALELAVKSIFKQTVLPNEIIIADGLPSKYGTNFLRPLF